MMLVRQNGSGGGAALRGGELEDKTALNLAYILDRSIILTARRVEEEAVSVVDYGINRQYEDDQEDIEMGEYVVKEYSGGFGANFFPNRNV